jgi:hypothetical protein
MDPKFKTKKAEREHLKMVTEARLQAGKKKREEYLRKKNRNDRIRKLASSAIPSIFGAVRLYQYNKLHRQNTDLRRLLATAQGAIPAPVIPQGGVWDDVWENDVNFVDEANPQGF